MANVSYGDADFTLSATGGGSGNAVTYASSNTGVATVSGNTVTIVGAGTTNIIASQLGNANYANAIDVAQQLTVDKQIQVITFNPIPEVVCGQTSIDLSYYGFSSLGKTITFASDNPSVATITGGTANIIGSGTATITASQAGDANTAAATNKQQTLTIAATQENYTVDNPADQLICDGSDYILPVLTEGNYFSGSGGTGSTYNAGDVIDASMTMYVYGVSGTSNACVDENSFDITINNLPVDNLPDVTETGSYTLPALVNGNYYTGTGGTGSALSAGEAITSSQTIYIYNNDADSGCTRESSFDVSIENHSALHFEQVANFTDYDYLSVADNSSIDFTDHFTYEAWVNFEQLTELSAGFAWRCLFAKSRYTDTYALMFNAIDNTLRFYHAGFAGNITDFTWSTLSAGVWHHVAVKLDGTNNKASILIDGVEVASSIDAGSGSLTPNNLPLQIGAGENRTSDPYPFDGAMDEIRFWNIARTDSDINANKSLELQGNESGLVLYYNFNEGVAGADNTSISNINDLSSSNNNGTFNSFALTGSTSNYV